MPRPETGLTRRNFLGGGVVGALALGFGPFDGLIRRAGASEASGPGNAEAQDVGYGPLRSLTRRDPESGYEQELFLPEGFDFAIFGVEGTTMSDGHPTPIWHDGMACFAGPRGSWRLVRNHEGRSGIGRAFGNEADRYDQLGGGGTTTLQVRFHGSGITLERDWVSLAGTSTNCAGGPTPWGSWLSCEETTEGPPSRSTQEKHGYVFEVSSRADGPVEPRPLRALGRFVHEAAAVDPQTSIVYLTEDNLTSGCGFYRFIPDQPYDLQAGRLQMLKVDGRPGYVAGVGQQQGVELPVTWVDILDPDPGIVGDPATFGPTSPTVYAQGAAQGGATFVRLEGCWWGGQSVYFTSTNGGDIAEGQIWEYRPRQGDGDGYLTLVYESDDRDVMSMPDNITVTPQGSLLVCEDTLTRALDGHQYQQLVGVTLDGAAFPFCVDPTNHSEWDGATFSPDGRVLFANMQGRNSQEAPGLTIAFWGPWRDGPL